MDGLLNVAAKYGVRVIEDVAQSCGASYKGKLLGTIGDLGVFSFQMNKLITSGEGGAVVTNDPGLFTRAVRYHDQGIFRDKDRYGLTSPDEEDAVAGLNFRMSEFTGAVMVEQLKKLSGIIAGMKSIHDKLRERLSAEAPGLKLRKLYDSTGTVGCYLGLILPTAEMAKSFIQAVNAENISAYLLYEGIPLVKRPVFQQRKTIEKNGFPYNYPFQNKIDYSDSCCPNALDLCPRTVFVPIFPTFSQGMEELIAEGLISVYRTLSGQSE